MKRLVILYRSAAEPRSVNNKEVSSRANSETRRGRVELPASLTGVDMSVKCVFFYI